MNRRGFLSFLGIGAVAAPAVVELATSAAEAAAAPVRPTLREWGARLTPAEITEATTMRVPSLWTKEQIELLEQFHAGKIRLRFDRRGLVKKSSSGPLETSYDEWTKV